MSKCKYEGVRDVIGIKVKGNLENSSISENKFIGCEQAIDIEGDLHNTKVDNNEVYLAQYDNDVDEIVRRIKQELLDQKDCIGRTNKKENIVNMMSNIVTNVISEVILKASGLR